MLAIVAAAFVLAALSAPKPSSACSCLPPGPPADALRDSAAVFAGEAVSVDARRAPGEADDTSPMSYDVRFRVSEAWKGIDGETVTVTTAGSSAACGIAFEEGADYLVYAYRPEGGELMTGLCSRTAPLATAGDDLQALGEGQAPKPVAPPAEAKPMGMTRGQSLLAGSIVALAIVGYVIGRSGRKDRTP